MLIALNGMDIDFAADLRLSAWVGNVSQNGLTWHLDSWKDTVLNRASAQFIAFMPDGPAPAGPENNGTENR